ncbi:hypothetical protein ABT337_09025 [Saccharopolyspora hirsuta]|uniref:HXXEE domain-containing protein n=1 Tax=Saccharopolyspora hirsuta TaxID=1837 RepID=A0A5M7BGI9_SACHI|nr:hypothetical protein [Saccharopolyspora hirsuta]KAA5826844.1 hypothetical protein F1721_30565 [Saccharopolyspora hirsuta]
MRTWLRAGLAALTFVHAATGVWTSFFPRSFYDDVPTVNDYPPFNEHLFRDFGAMNLAMAVVLGAAAVRLERTLVQIALAANLVWAVPHLVFHAAHPTGSALVAALAAVVVIPSVLLVLSRGASPAGALQRRSRW